jgi:hypothetical protein
MWELTEEPDEIAYARVSTDGVQVPQLSAARCKTVLREARRALR